MDEPIRQLLEAAVRIAPPGTRFMVNARVPLNSADIYLCCDGADPMMAYYCGRHPGHPGRCESFNKGVSFDPVNR